jgi:hypothetical protein
VRCAILFVCGRRSVTKRVVLLRNKDSVMEWFTLRNNTSYTWRVCVT